MASDPPPLQEKLRNAWNKTIGFVENALDLYIWTWEEVGKKFADNAGYFFSEPTLEDTLVEKIGGGPHGYGDPADTSIRKEEHYLFPRMVWKRVRFEKCCDVIENYYACINNLENKSSQSCKKEEKAMFDCKAFYYSPEQIDIVESDVIKDYVKLRSVFRETGNDDDLWKIKMLMLEPVWEKLRERSKTEEGQAEFKKLESTAPKLVIN